MDAQVGGAPVAKEAVQAAAHAARTAPTSFAPYASPVASKPATPGPSSQRSPSAIGESKAQPTASTPSAAELEEAAAESRISQGPAARCVPQRIE